MIDISHLKQNLRTYGGLSCLKIGVTYNNCNYLVKFPGNLKEKNMKNIELSYSNSSVCEYLCSHIFKMLGMEVHETMLAVRNGKMVVMCKDFLGRGEKLAEFRELKATFEPAFVNKNGDLTDGTGSDIDEALLVIREHPIFQLVAEAEDFFWEMFVIDAIIGNPDRNNGNWGLIVDMDDSVRLAPVYDNGNALNDKWDDQKKIKFLENEPMFINEAYIGRVCFYTRNGRRINPFQLIESGQYAGCNKALNKILSQDFGCIYDFIRDCDELSEVSKEFNNRLLRMRIDILKSYIK